MEQHLLTQLVEEGIQMPFHYLLNAGKRVYWLYLLSSLLIAAIVYRSQGRARESFWNDIFNQTLWFGRSARIDYGLIFLNAFVKVLFIAPLLVGVVWLATQTSTGLTQQFGPASSSLSYTTLVLLYTISLVLVNDFFSFLVHYVFHIVPFLWAYHKVHHSATSLNPFTQYRMHPVELLANNLRGIIVKGLVTGVFMYWAGGSISILTILGVNIFNFLFLFAGANLRHSPVRFAYYAPLEHVFISPYQHQIHHSNAPTEFNTNLGSRLAIWDWLFGTLRLSRDVPQISYGLGPDDSRYDTLTKNLLNPFRDSFSRS